jgi:hypothetical protein
MARGDLLLSTQGTWIKVLSIVSLQTQERVYNRAIQDNHNYFVGLAGVRC